MSKIYDVALIGAGPGGYVTAIRAAQLGLKVAIIEREHLGGICLNWGCIPTKSLLRSAEIFDYVHKAKDYGLSVEGKIAANIEDIVSRSRDASARLNKGVAFLMAKNKIDIIWGEAMITSPTEIHVSKTSKPATQPQNPIPKNVLREGIYKAKHIIIATGARPRPLPGIEPDNKLMWTYVDALKPKNIPKSLVVVGSGAIGVEFASFYRSLGVDVTLVELKSHVLSAEDIEISTIVRNVFEKRGIKVITEAKVSSVKKKENSVSVTIETKSGSLKSITASHLILASGVQGNIENLGLEKLGIKTDNGCVSVDDYGRTNLEGIYAIGDVAGPPMLAHKAEHEGIACIEKIAGFSDSHVINKKNIPRCTYCTPQVASIGITEDEAKQQGIDVRVGRYSFSANGKAIALGEDTGMIKTIFNKNTGELLGAHMVGSEVTELIQGISIAINLETTEKELMQTIFPHPTLSETIKESVFDAYGRVINA